MALRYNISASTVLALIRGGTKLYREVLSSVLDIMGAQDNRLPQSVAALSSLSTQPKEPKASLAPPAPPLATTGAARLFLLVTLTV
uniref:Uncharacterized protein n=1 Tax=Oryza nivara TaxID=4536 RepID=A0A0E0IY49_ORYNI